MRLRALVLPALMTVGAAAMPASAQPACSGPDERLMSWPDVNPVWQFCWLRPADSSGANGSGIEIRDVHYNGHLVLKRGHVPIVNVQYDSGSCGGANHCYRDWTNTRVEHARRQRLPAAVQRRDVRLRRADVSSGDRLPAASGRRRLYGPASGLRAFVLPRGDRGEIRRPPRSDQRDQGGVVPLRDQVDVLPRRALPADVRLQRRGERMRGVHAPSPRLLSTGLRHRRARRRHRDRGAAAQAGRSRARPPTSDRRSPGGDHAHPSRSGHDLVGHRRGHPPRLSHPAGRGSAPALRMRSPSATSGC